jgi:molybdopterin-guanine dinucleotide biosynthesis protein A
MSNTPWLGIFVGGRATRMGGYPKGLLAAPGSGEPLLARLARMSRELGAEPVLVGEAAAYAGVAAGLRSLADEPAGVGPLGGLNALLHAAGQRPVLAVACDMPRISRELLSRLLEEAPAALVLSPRNAEGFWEPLCARYDSPRAAARCAGALGRGLRSFQRWFAELEVTELLLSAAEQAQLQDWDSPEDVTRGAR